MPNSCVPFTDLSQGRSVSDVFLILQYTMDILTSAAQLQDDRGTASLLSGGASSNADIDIVLGIVGLHVVTSLGEEVLERYCQ